MTIPERLAQIDTSTMGTPRVALERSVDRTGPFEGTEAEAVAVSSTRRW